MLYGKRDIDECFSAPPKEFRGAPFWAWNTRLDRERLDEQVRVFDEMGFGGFHIHSRIGLDTEYLGPEFMAEARHAHDLGLSLGMRTFLYDEDKWPSGFGAGRVTADPDYRARYLLLSPHDYPDGPFRRNAPATSRITKDGTISFISSFDIKLDDDGFLDSYTVSDDRSYGNMHLYLVVTGDTPWFNNQSYVDVMNKKAIEKFISVTHEKYREEFGSEFGKSVVSIFSDEPQFPKEERLSSSSLKEEVGLPCSDSAISIFSSLYGQSLLHSIPDIVYEGRLSKRARWCYHEALSEAFSDSFCRTIGEWCAENGLSSTGHVMAEATLDSQSRSVGDALRCYRHYSIPGIDMLADRHEYNTVKQAESGVRQWGKEGLMCEMYGVTNWDYDFRGHKSQGDWLAALGVTLRVPHLSWLSMAGEAKRDYPSPIDQHAPWHREYRLIEDNYARLNLALSDRKAICRVGVIHPIESYWTLMGPDDKTAERRKSLDDRFSFITETLLFNLIDFDFISESQIPELYDGQKGFGKASYDAILVPDPVTIRRTTLDALSSFSRYGRVAFIGNMPESIDCSESFSSDIPFTLIPNDEERIISFLECVRDVDVRGDGYLRRKDLLYSLKGDDCDRFLFIAHGRKRDRMEKSNMRVAKSQDIVITVKGEWKATLYDTFTSEIKELSASIVNGSTVITHPFYENDSLLIRLERGVPSPVLSERKRSAVSEYRVRRPDSFSLEEDNVLLLDRADAYLDGALIAEDEEILRIDDIIRGKLSLQRRSEAFPQPWLIDEDSTRHDVRLVFSFQSFAECDASLAFEMQDASVSLNGETVPPVDDGYYVDRSIRRFRIGRIRKGINEISISFPFSKKTNIEWCYLLGDFGVSLPGEDPVVIPMPEKASWGDLSRGAFAFYGGNAEYSFEAEMEKGEWILSIPSYKGSLIRVFVDGIDKGTIIWEPYEIDLGSLDGRHAITLRLYGNRYNSFGQLHNRDEFESYWGPKTWRTQGSCWSYLYRLKEYGILAEPILRVEK
ncbi:MAG: hypothetical protein SPJ34_06395 [Candidatus Ornithospirochaeta sp.]|nr:hypothetical protein [Candidatus Ornithospirochaeta sp.]